MKITALILFVFSLINAGQLFAASRYVDNADGTVSDTRTGLVWQQSDDDTSRTWQDALTYCNGFTLGGANDWRLPNHKELFSIVDQSVSDPAIDSTIFPGVSSGVSSSYFWTSTSYATNPALAWFVTFYLGTSEYLNKQPNSYFARCVR